MSLGGLPHVEIREIDLSIQPKLTQQFIEAGVIVAPRGSLKPRFIPDSATLRSVYFPVDKRYKRGLDTSLLEAEVALEASALWLVRAAHDDIKYAGATLFDKDSTNNNATWTTSLLGGYTDTGDIFDPDEDSFDFSSVSDATAVIIAESPGAWGNDLAINIKNLDATGKVPNADVIEVYVKGEKKETWYVSTDPNAKYNNKSIYLPTVLKQSAYIRGFVNPLKQGKRLKEVTGLKLGAGDDGSAVTVGDRIRVLSQLEAETYKYQVLLDFGVADPAYANKLTEIAYQKRSFAVLSVPYETVASANYVNDIKDYRESHLTIGGNYASFAGLYGNWLKTYIVDIDDAYYLSPSGYVGQVIARTWANYNPWTPPAGFRYGVLLALDVRRRMKEAEMGLLYEAGINPIRFAPGKGIAVFGQKTLYPFLSALDRVNVRLLLNYVELIGKEFLESFIFDLNDKTTWDLVYSGLEALFKNLKARGAFYNYKVFHPGDATSSFDIDNYIMRVPVAVQPVKSAEWIDFVVAIMKTGGDMSVAASL